MASIDLGMVTAYAYAVAGGYTGSEQDFEDLLGNIAIDLGEIENLSVTVTTLPEGSQATASYNNGVLSLGIPKGDTGATGAEGPEGPTGPTGNGIQSIAKTGTSGNVDTYTITYTSGQTTTFTVTNADGETEEEVIDARQGADGIDYASLGAAIRGQYSDLKSELYENISPTMIDGSYINASGNVGSNASYSLSDYTKVENIVAVYSAMASGYAIYYFDENRQKISAQDVSNPTFETHLVKLNPPSNAVYFRFNDYTPTLASSSCYLVKSIPKENTSSLQIAESDLTTTKNTAFDDLNVVWEDGYFINSSNGNTATNDRYKSSTYLDISQYKKLFVRSKVTASGLGFAFYDEAKNYISGQTTVSGEFWSVDIPYNAYYVRTCTLADSVGECFGFGERSDADANFINQYVFEFTDGHYINITNGNDSTIVGNSATDFIKLYPNSEKLTIWSATNNSLIGMAFYNANKEFVSGNLLYTVGGILESKTLNVPKSARYFRFSCLTSSKAYAKAYSPITVEMQMQKNIALESLPLVSAKFVCVGDSLTAGDFYPKGTNTSAGDTQKNYPYFLGRMLNVPIINAGKSGATPLSWWSEVHPSIDFSDADTMILWLGTNGGLTDTLATDVDPYSDYNDYANTNTGTYCKIIEDFLHETTDGKVFLVNTYNTDNVTDSVINQIGAKYGLPVFDIKYLMRAYSPEMFNTNVVHRNTYGNLKIAEFFRNQMAEWWSDNIDEMDFCFHTKENPLT